MTLKRQYGITAKRIPVEEGCTLFTNSSNGYLLYSVLDKTCFDIGIPEFHSGSRNRFYLRQLCKDIQRSGFLAGVFKHRDIRRRFGYA